MARGVANTSSELFSAWSPATTQTQEAYSWDTDALCHGRVDKLTRCRDGSVSYHWYDSASRYADGSASRPSDVPNHTISGQFLGLLLSADCTLKYLLLPWYLISYPNVNSFSNADLLRMQGEMRTRLWAIVRQMDVLFSFQLSLPAVILTFRENYSPKQDVSGLIHSHVCWKSTIIYVMRVYNCWIKTYTPQTFKSNKIALTLS